MRGAVLVEPGALEVRELADPTSPGLGQALVRIRRVGVCGTDLHAFRGRQPFLTYPRILGHELAVEVVDVGAGVTGVSTGDRAAVRPAIACGTCDACRRGFENACETLVVLGAHIDGGMRERLVIPASALHRSATLSLDQLALVEPLAIGGHAVARVAPAPDERALVIGAGPIGLAVVAHLLARGLRPWVADVSAGRRAFAASWSGADVLDPGRDAADVVRRALGGRLPTLVFDATGAEASMRAAFDLVATGGRLVLVGLFQGDLTFHDPEFHRRELTVLGSRNATAADFSHSIELIESGRADVSDWITHRAPLEAVPGMFPSWDGAASGVIKAVIEL
jgi:2-desacetyl-2-hydroxyethyl bacteriochlorophyllide A dehydrogenase